MNIEANGVRREERGAWRTRGQSWVLFCSTLDSTLALCIAGRRWGTWVCMEDWFWASPSPGTEVHRCRNPLWKPAQRLHIAQPHHPVSFKWLQITVHTLSLACKCSSYVFLNSFQSAAGWIWGYRTQGRWKPTLFFRGCSWRENSAFPGEFTPLAELKNQQKVLNFLVILLV